MAGFAREAVYFRNARAAPSVGTPVVTQLWTPQALSIPRRARSGVAERKLARRAVFFALSLSFSGGGQKRDSRAGADRAE